MSLNIKRIELPFDEDNVDVIIAVQSELDDIDTAGGTLVSYVEYFSEGMNEGCYTFIYTTP